MMICVIADEESETMKSLVFAKEKELALALMKVAELTSQLDQLRGTAADPVSDETAPVSRKNTRPASTGSIQEHRHPRVVVKPTTAPPPPPVAAAAVLSPAGDKVDGAPECTCSINLLSSYRSVHRFRQGSREIN